jgi:hypothetical protein
MLLPLDVTSKNFRKCGDLLFDASIVADYDDTITSADKLSAHYAVNGA